MTVRGGLVFAGIGLLVALTLVLLLRGLRGAPAEVAVAAAAEPPRYELQGIRWTRLDPEGRPLLQATAAQARYFDDRSARFEELQVQRLGAEGPWTLTAPRGVMPPDEKRIHLTEPAQMNGRLKTGEPVRVTADGMWVDLARREIYTDERVVLQGPQRQARARGLRADWQGTRVQLMNEVEVEYVVQPRG